MSAHSEAKEGHQCRGSKTIATKAAVLSNIQHPLLRKAQQPSLQKCNVDQLMQNARQINSHAVGYLVHGACKRSLVQCRNEYNKFTCSRSLLCPAGLPTVHHFAVAQVKTSTTNLVSVLVGQPTVHTKRHSSTHLICMQNGCQPLCESESGKIFMQTMSHPLCDQKPLCRNEYYKFPCSSPRHLVVFTGSLAPRTRSGQHQTLRLCVCQSGRGLLRCRVTRQPWL